MYPTCFPPVNLSGGKPRRQAKEKTIAGSTTARFLSPFNKFNWKTIRVLKESESTAALLIETNIFNHDFILHQICHCVGQINYLKSEVT
jgi:hypothetical protein